MDFAYDNCPHCFAQRTGGATCPVCGFQYSAADKQPDNALPVFTCLNNRYLIGHCLGKGGFGITYSALDLAANARCAIKEYYPSEFAVRHKEDNCIYPVQTSKGKNVFEHAKLRFLEEARLLYQLRDTPNIVRLYNYFSENNTAYIVMEFLDGCDLRKYAKQCGGRIPLEMAIKIIDSCSSALEEVHSKGFLHRDISPDNIFVRNSSSNSPDASNIVLIDFGAARNYIGNNAATVLLKPGFAPPEAYSKSGNRGPWTDIYSLAATVYNVLSGQAIIDALFLARGTRQPTLYELGVRVPPAFSAVIESSMQLDPRLRPQSMREFRTKIMNSVGNYQNDIPRNDIVPDNKIPPAPVQNQCIGKIIITDGEKKGQYLTVKDGQTVKIGRSLKLSDMVVDYIGEISRIHCTVSFNAKERLFYITDVSANGTFLDTNERLFNNRAYKLASGQQFYLVRRDCMLMCKIEESEG